MNIFKIYSVSILIFLIISCGDQSEKSNTTDLKNVTDSQDSTLPSSKAYKDPNLPPTADYSGDHIVKFETGITNIRGFFRFGKKHGKWASFYPSGQLQSETEFDNGIRKGKSVVWYENGKVMYEGEYKKDNRFGVWKTYDSSGTLLETKKY